MFMTFVMRCCMRPKMMSDAIDSILRQTSKDFEIIFIPDFKRRGVNWANKQFGLNTHRIDGLYVYAVDDDSLIIYNDLIKDLKQIHEKQNPGVIMVKGKRPKIKPYILPKASVWGKRDKLVIRSTNGSCFISCNDAWKKLCYHYGNGGSGDWNYMQALKNSSYTFYWFDKIVKEAQKLSRGKVESNCPNDWFKRICRRYGIKEVSKGDWRLKP